MNAPERFDVSKIQIFTSDPRRKSKSRRTKKPLPFKQGLVFAIAAVGLVYLGGAVHRRLYPPNPIIEAFQQIAAIQADSRPGVDLRGLKIKSARYASLGYPRWGQAYPVYSVQIKNDTDLPVSSVSFDAMRVKPGRTVAFEQAYASLDIQGGIEVGETAELRVGFDSLGAPEFEHFKDGCVYEIRISSAGCRIGSEDRHTGEVDSSTIVVDHAALIEAERQAEQKLAEYRA
jgi:hypothetical protein